MHQCARAEQVQHTQAQQSAAAARGSGRHGLVNGERGGRERRAWRRACLAASRLAPTHTHMQHPRTGRAHKSRRSKSRRSRSTLASCPLHVHQSKKAGQRLLRVTAVAVQAHMQQAWGQARRLTGAAKHDSISSAPTLSAPRPPFSAPLSSPEPRMETGNRPTVIQWRSGAVKRVSTC